MLEVKNITKYYKNGKTEFKALSNVSIKFGSKGLVVILGKSGCGKSTLLNIIGGLDQPTTGTAIINGKATSGFSKADFDAYRNTYVGIVFQEFNLIDDITVFENIDMTLRLQEKTADVNTVDEALGLVGLHNLGYRKPSELSGGQRQRVALARALLKKPEIILADEPTGALDTNTSEEVFETLKKIAETKLVIVVTHDKDLARSYGQRIIEMVDGKIVSDIECSKDNVKEVKELSSQVIEVSAGGEISSEMISSKLNKNNVSYLGISHDKDRIALAYTETVDTFYAPKEGNLFSETKQENIPDDKKPFALSRGKLPIGVAVTMGRANINRTKKKYRFLTRLNIICFTMVALALIIGGISIPNLTAKTAFESGSQPIVTIGKLPSQNDLYNFKYEKLDNSSIDNITQIFGSDKFGKCSSISFTPNMPDRIYPDENILDVQYKFIKFNTSIEGILPGELGFDLLHGVDRANDRDEIIISDFAAFEIQRSGYVGYNPDGKYGIYYPSEIKSIVGAKINAHEQSGKYYKVVGIFKTNSSNYKSIATASILDKKSKKDKEIFAANREFAYNSIFTAEGFSNEFVGGNKMSSIVNITAKIPGSSSVHESVAYSNMSMNISNFDKTYNSGEVLGWVRHDIQKNNNTLPSGLIDNMPSELLENQIIVSFNFMRMLLQAYNLDTISQLIVHPSFKEAIAKKYSFKATIESGYTANVIFQEEEFEIVGIINDRIYSQNLGIQLSNKFVKTISSGQDKPDFLVFSKGISALSLQSKIKELDKENFIVGTARAKPDALMQVKDILNTMGKVFTYIAIGFSLFAFLVLFNYMSASIRFRQKEVAVYRVVGAKPLDVSKIFLAEGFFIILKTTLWASIFTFFISLFLNSVMEMMLSYFNITYSLVNFTFWHPMIIFAICTFFVFLSSLLPIARITCKKPADAIKML